MPTPLARRIASRVRAVRERVVLSRGLRSARRTRAPESASARTSASAGFVSRVTAGRFDPCELASGCGFTERTGTPSRMVRSSGSLLALLRVIRTCTSTFCPGANCASTPLESDTCTETARIPAGTPDPPPFSVEASLVTSTGSPWASGSRTVCPRTCRAASKAPAGVRFYRPGDRLDVCFGQHRSRRNRLGGHHHHLAAARAAAQFVHEQAVEDAGGDDRNHQGNPQELR